MRTIDLRRFEGDEIVIHFGGSLTSVDAYTFANSLVAIADSVRALNSIVNPGQAVEVRLDAVAPGSFKARIKRVKKGLGGFFSRAPENLFWALFAYLVLDPVFEKEPERTTTVYEDRVEIRVGDDLVIIPREAYDQVPAAKNEPRVRRNISRAFETIESDDAVTDFGITPSLSDREPLVQFPRSDFPKLVVQQGELVQVASERRHRSTKARLVVNKLWLRHAHRKWTFEWNGVPLSAAIKDTDFLLQLRNRQISILSGDALDVELSYIQNFDHKLGVYVNDVQTYAVDTVYAKVDQDTGDQKLF